MSQIEFELATKDGARLQKLCGNLNENIHLMEIKLHVSISHRDVIFLVEGEQGSELKARQVIESLYEKTNDRKGTLINKKAINLAIAEAEENPNPNPTPMPKPISAPKTIPTPNENQNISYIAMDDEEDIVIDTECGSIRGKGQHQCDYLRRIYANDISFGLGPAGTGKTYLAVACAVAMLNESQVKKIILVSPAVDASERLGFMPSDLRQIADPYLIPLHDALYEMLGAEETLKLIKDDIIEIMPLAFTRGRTLSDAFIILDGAHNTTAKQMKMFLTRIGFGSKAVITGDLSQIDLPKGVRSGLKDAHEILMGIDDISHTEFDSQDAVRHPLVRLIVEAYEKDSHSGSSNRKDPAIRLGEFGDETDETD